MIDLAALDFDKTGGLVTVVTQDARTGAVLMVAHADREALERSITTGEMHYRSRTRGLWRKGETSGHTQALVSLEADCDGDAVLARVIPNGPACHTNARSCFGEQALAADALGELDRTLAARAAPSLATETAPSYTRRLLADRNLRLKKLGEEASELVIACAEGNRERAAEEAVDLLFHTLVALRSLEVGLDELRTIVAARARPPAPSRPSRTPSGPPVKPFVDVTRGVIVKPFELLPGPSGPDVGPRPRCDRFSSR